MHMCFADYLMPFCYGDEASVSVLMQAISMFSKCSGLIQNVSKSCIFFSSVNDHTERAILQHSGFSGGSFL